VISHIRIEIRPELILRQQCGILDNGRKLDPAILREVSEGQFVKLYKIINNNDIIIKVPANLVPAAAVIRGEQALLILTGRKGCVDG
jgi:hypothetical protein